MEYLEKQWEKEFPGGKNDWTGAVQVAVNCPEFRTDVEDELVADAPRSCYNCRYRRWTALSFTCLKGKLTDI